MARIVEVRDATLIRSTSKAGLYSIEDSEECVSEVWIPWSQLKENSIDRDGESGSIFIPMWLADDKELEFIEDQF